MTAARRYYGMQTRNPLRSSQFEAELFASDMLHVLRCCGFILRRWRQSFFQHIRDEYSDEGYSANAEREPESCLGRQGCPRSLAVYFEFPGASTNRHTTATGLCYEEAEVVTGNVAAGYLALWLIDGADDGVGRQR